MDPLLDRITERRAELSEQAVSLRKELAEVEAELERVASAEQVVTQLLAETEVAIEAAGRAGCAAAAAGAEAGASGQWLAVPHRGDGAEVEDLPEEYRRLVRIVAEDQPVACKRVTAKLGLSGEPRHTEAVRGKLKRLVARGWLVEPDPGRFALL